MSDAALNIALVSNSVSTAVSKGENAGHTLTHNNVVRAFTTVRTTANSQAALPIPPDFDLADGAVITYLQNEKTGAVLGAERKSLK